MQVFTLNYVSSIDVDKVVKGLLSPVGHGAWTAILASVMFRESGPNRFRLDRAVLGAYLTVVVLHGLWDGLPQLVGTMTDPSGFVCGGQDALRALGDPA